MMKIKLPIGIVLVLALVLGCAGSEVSGGEGQEKLTPGVIKNGVYSSAYAGITFTAPDGWEFAGDDQLATAMGMDMDKPLKGRFPEDIADLQIVYDMFAQDTSTGASAIVMYENLKTAGDMDITAGDYMEKVKELVNSQNSGYTVIDSPDVRIGEGIFKVIRCELTGQNIIQYYYARRVGDAIVSITITAGSEKSAAEVKSYFS